MKLKKLGLRRNAVVMLLTVSILAIGCHPLKEVKVDADDNGNRVELEKGQVLVITLFSNPSTGYRWEVVECQEPILQQKGEAEFKSSDTGHPPLLGAGGMETFRFEAKNTGEAILQLVYHRPWEEGVEPADIFSLKIAVVH